MESPQVGQKSKVAAGILGILLGALEFTTLPRLHRKRSRSTINQCTFLRSSITSFSNLGSCRRNHLLDK